VEEGREQRRKGEKRKEGNRGRRGKRRGGEKWGTLLHKSKGG